MHPNKLNNESNNRTESEPVAPTDKQQRAATAGGLNRRSFMLGAATAGAAGALAGCSQLNSQAGAQNRTSTEDASVGQLEPSTKSGVVTDPLTVSGNGLPANETFNLVWHSVHGHWGILKGSEIAGAQYEPRRDEITTLKTDVDGTFSYDWQFPDDYGGDHTISVQDTNGTVLADATVSLNASLELTDRSASLGSSFTVVGHGIGTDAYHSLYNVNWDNSFTGLLTATTTRGRFEATVPAAGPPGKHTIRIGSGSHGGFPYLNHAQSPYNSKPEPTWVVHVTKPSSDLPTNRRESLSTLKTSNLQKTMYAQYPNLEANSKAEIDLAPAVGRVKEKTVVQGHTFPSGTNVELVWYGKRGNRVKDGFSTFSKSLTTVTTDSQGTFETRISVPDGLGNVHPIVAKVRGSAVAVGTFTIQPSIVGIDPAEGPVGTEFQVHIKGVGWTEYDNTYTLTYDNHFLGYACGFNTQGDVKIPLTAVGSPGYHLIDLYPALYEGDKGQPNYYNKPHLTTSDHPGRPLPVLHFAFYVTNP